MQEISTVAEGNITVTKFVDVGDSEVNTGGVKDVTEASPAGADTGDVDAVRIVFGIDSDRRQPVEIRLSDPVPADDDVTIVPDSDRWRVAEEGLVYDRTLDPDAEVTAAYTVTGDGAPAVIDSPSRPWLTVEGAPAEPSFTRGGSERAIPVAPGGGGGRYGEVNAGQSVDDEEGGGVDGPGYTIVGEGDRVDLSRETRSTRDADEESDRDGGHSDRDADHSGRDADHSGRDGEDELGMPDDEVGVSDDEVGVSDDEFGMPDDEVGISELTAQSFDEDSDPEPLEAQHRDPEPSPGEGDGDDGGENTKADIADTAEEDSETSTDTGTLAEPKAESRPGRKRSVDGHEPAAEVVDSLIRTLERGVSDEQRERLGRALAETVRPRASHDVQVSYLQSRFHELAAYIDALEAFIDDEGTADELLTEVTEELEVVQATVDRLQDEHGRFDAQFEDLDAQFEDLDARFDRLRTELGEHSDRTDDRVETIADSLESHRDRTEDDVQSLEATLEAVLEEQRDLRDQLDEVVSFKTSVREAFHGRPES